MRLVLILVVVSFVCLCGVLVIESGLFESGLAGKQTPCILLQQTTDGENKETTNPPALQNANLQAIETVKFDAYNAEAETIILGAEDPCTEDPETGFKFQLELDSRGAAIRKATFSNGNDKGFDDRDYKNPQPLVILSPVGGELMSMANREFVFIEQKQQLRLHELHWRSYGIETNYDDGSQTVRFEAVIKTSTGEPVIKLVKTYRIVPGSYSVNCDLTVENLSASDLKIRFNLAGPTGLGREGFRADMRKAMACFRDSKGEITSTRLKFNAKKLRKTSGFYSESLAKPEDNFLWIAATNKYFAAIVVPVPDKGKNYCDWVTDKTGRFYNPDRDQRADTGDEAVGVDLRIASSVLASAGQDGSTKTYNLQLYLGPKDKSLFDKNDTYRKLGFVHTIDFMPCFCCPTAIIHPLAFGIIASMKWMYGFIGNYGVVIIILVFLFRIVIHPLTKKSQVSMRKFQKIMSTPEAQQIKKKYANNRAEQQKQVLELYKKHGVSPAGQFTSMLPMMVQLPIWIALYSSIYTSINLRGAPFLPFWITDLSVPDALIRFPAVTLPLFGKLDSFNLLPILMGVAMYLQQKLMPHSSAAAVDPKTAQQQKMMMIMMPLFLPLVLYKGPSGVNLYIMSSVFAGVIEQYVIRKHLREKEEAESQGLVSVTSKTGGKVKKKKPKPFYKQF